MNQTVVGNGWRRWRIRRVSNVSDGEAGAGWLHRAAKWAEVPPSQDSYKTSEAQHGVKRDPTQENTDGGDAEQGSNSAR